MEDRFAPRNRLTATTRFWGLIGRSSLALLAGALCLSIVACGGSGKRPAATSSNASSSSTSGSAGGTTSSGAPTTAPSSGGALAASGGAAASAGTGSSGAAAAGSNGVPTGDQDGDGPNDVAFDKDDSFITTFGHASSPADGRAITSLVKRYYAAIASGDGVTACTLLFFVIVESAPETYGQTAFDATAGRGKGCGPVLSKVFKGSHQQLLAENRHLKVLAIRIQGKRAWVLLRFGPKSVRRIIAYREGNSWKIGELLDTELV
jgi:hypothetical protein